MTAVRVFRFWRPAEFHCSCHELLIRLINSVAIERDRRKLSDAILVTVRRKRRRLVSRTKAVATSIPAYDVLRP
jgi:hypothetical protein